MADMKKFYWIRTSIYMPRRRLEQLSIAEWVRDAIRRPVISLKG